MMSKELHSMQAVEAFDHIGTYSVYVAMRYNSNFFLETPEENAGKDFILRIFTSEEEANYYASTYGYYWQTHLAVKNISLDELFDMIEEKMQYFDKSYQVNYSRMPYNEHPINLYTIIGGEGFTESTIWN